MLARLVVGVWLLAYGKYRLRGTGVLIRALSPWFPGFKAYPLEVQGLGTVRIDLSNKSAFALLVRIKLGDEGPDAVLYAAMERFLKPGGVLWDIGAHTGYFAAHFAHPRLQLRAIHAFEPNPEPLVLLRTLLGNCPVVSHPPLCPRCQG
jgi:hypothetical protein